MRPDRGAAAPLSDHRTRRPGPRSRRAEDGYNLVILIMIITVLNIMVAVALPLWSYTIRRDREEETIFRGLQYAEAIRVFRQRFGRYPTSLEELVKVKPRSIRQLYDEPLSEDGEFGLVVEAPPQTAGARPGAPGAPGAAAQPTPQPLQVGNRQPQNVGGLGIGGGPRVNLVKLPRAKGGDSKPKTATSGAVAIHGVYLDYHGESLRSFLGQDNYDQWVFTAELFKPPITAPGRPVPSLRADWIGKAFPDGLSPQLAGGSGPGQGGELAPASGPGSGKDEGGTAASPPSDQGTELVPGIEPTFGEVPPEEPEPGFDRPEDQPFWEDEEPPEEDPLLEPDAGDQDLDDGEPR